MILLFILTTNYKRRAKEPGEIPLLPTACPEHVRAMRESEGSARSKLVVIGHGFQKKTQKTPEREIAKAARIKQEYYEEKKRNKSK